jgi:hypothetical protein
LLYEVERKVFRTAVRFRPGPPENFLNDYTGTTEKLAKVDQSKDQPVRRVIVVSSTAESFLMGLTRFSTGQRVTKWTARECETRRIGVTQSKKRFKLNANDAFFGEVRLAA